MNASKAIRICCVAALAATTTGLASAADTVEPWDTGAADVDHYWGYEGIGLGRNERSVFGDTMLGWGVGHTLSAYLGATVTGNGALTEASTDPYLGVYGTPVDTAHLDLDLFMDFSQSDGEVHVTPAFELTIDAAPDLADYGLYLRTGVPIYGRSDPANPDDLGKTTFHVEPLVGLYKTINASQFLIEFDMALRPDPGEEERETEVGGIAIGWNYVLSDTLEWINEGSIDIPQGDEDVSFGVFTGFIATLGHSSE